MPSQKTRPNLCDLIATIPYRMAFAGGWIDQPFVSRHDTSPPGSMVVVALEPTFRCMERAGMATGTRNIAVKLWNGRLPDADPAELVRRLYAEENRGRAEPSGSQDMIGLIYPGVNRLDFDFRHEGGIFPAHIESCNDPAVARWLEEVIYMLPVEPRPQGYNPLGVKNFDPKLVRRLGQSGADCYDAIVARDAKALGQSMNDCMACWEAMLPHVVRHPTISVDLAGLLGYYQSRYAGAMYSGCGGGYLYVVSDRPVPGAFNVNVRVAKPRDERGNGSSQWFFRRSSSPQVRLLQEAARLGPVHVLLWSDAVVERLARPAAEVPAGRAGISRRGHPLRRSPHALPRSIRARRPAAAAGRAAGNLGRRFCQPHHRQGGLLPPQWAELSRSQRRRPGRLSRGPARCVRSHRAGENE